jgi:hypothetical protein
MTPVVIWWPTVPLRAFMRWMSYITWITDTKYVLMDGAGNCELYLYDNANFDWQPVGWAQWMEMVNWWWIDIHWEWTQQYLAADTFFDDWTWALNIYLNQVAIQWMVPTAYINFTWNLNLVPFGEQDIIEVTYDDLMTLVTAGNLAPWGYYRLMDYQTVHVMQRTHDQAINRWATMETFVWQAKSSNEFYPDWQSDQNADICRFDFTNTNIKWYGTGKRDYNLWDYSQDIIISNVTAPVAHTQTFTIPYPLLYSGWTNPTNLSRYVFQVKFGGASNITLGVADYGPTKSWTQVDNWDNTYTVTIYTKWVNATSKILSGSDLQVNWTITLRTSVDYTTATINWWATTRVSAFTPESRNGWMTYRKNITQQIEEYCDWRNVKFRRYKIDQTKSNILDYNDLTEYLQRDYCSSWGSIYISLQQQTGATPSATADTWWQFLSSSQVTSAYPITNSQITFGTKTFYRDITTYKDYFMFSTQVASPAFNITNVSDIRAVPTITAGGWGIDWLKNNVFMTTVWPTVKGIKIGSNSYNNTVIWQVTSSELWDTFANNFFWAQITSSQILSSQTGWFPAYVQYTSIGNQQGSIFCWGMDSCNYKSPISCVFWDQNQSNTWWYISSSTFCRGFAYNNISFIQNCAFWPMSISNVISWYANGLQSIWAVTNNVISGEITQLITGWITGSIISWAIANSSLTISSSEISGSIDASSMSWISNSIVSWNISNVNMGGQIAYCTIIWDMTDVVDLASLYMQNCNINWNISTCNFGWGVVSLTLTGNLTNCTFENTTDCINNVQMFGNFQNSIMHFVWQSSFNRVWDMDLIAGSGLSIIALDARCDLFGSGIDFTGSTLIGNGNMSKTYTRDATLWARLSYYNNDVRVFAALNA